MEKPFPALPTGNRSAVMAKQANRVTKTRGIPRADHSQNVMSCPRTVATMAMTTIFGAPPRGVPTPPRAGAMAESVHRERIMLLSGARLQDFPMATAMEMNRMVRGMLGAMADMTPAPKVKMRTIRTGLPLTKGRLKHQ